MGLEESKAERVVMKSTIRSILTEYRALNRRIKEEKNEQPGNPGSMGRRI